MKIQFVKDDGSTIEIVPGMRFTLRAPKQNGGPFTIWIMTPCSSGRDPIMTIECDWWIRMDWSVAGAQFSSWVANTLRMSVFSFRFDAVSDRRVDIQGGHPDHAIQCYIVD